MAVLALVRHGESTWNARGIWTGWKNPPLSQKGLEEARQAGKLLKDIKFDLAYISSLIRAKQTLEEIEKVLGVNLVTFENSALNERDYGDYTGKNKWEVKRQLGEEDFQKLRRGWNWPVPNGETLKDVYERTVPYYQQEILPKLAEGKNVLISAHGNSLRALVKYLDGLTDSEVENLEIATGEVIIYQIGTTGKVTSKEIRNS
ncbi:MAG: 2,3-bisphosphoglycerate-dependent phosphoglycerate mutase [Patescibacteria group bacterium]